MPGLVEQLRKESNEQTLLRMVRHARETLEAGVTTVRDLGSVDDLAIDLARAVKLGDGVGPRIVPSGRTVIMTGGHDPFWGVMGDGPQEALKAARRQIYRGAGVIKLSATGGCTAVRRAKVPPIRSSTPTRSAPLPTKPTSWASP